MNRYRGRAAWALAGLLALGALTTGCQYDSDDEENSKSETTVSTTANAGESKGETGVEWETKTDPVERAFTIELPKGWRNDAYLKRRGVVATPVATSESPDGASALFYGDPKLPTFVEPQAAMLFQHDDPNFRVQTYTPAERFLPDYLKSRFGRLPGFQVTGVSPEPELIDRLRASAEREGKAPYLQRADAVRVDFTFDGGDGKRRGAAYGTTFSVGMIWMASLAGIVSRDEPQKLKPLLVHLMDSQKALPEWKEKEGIAAADRQRQHEYVLARIAAGTEQLRIAHQNNMATLSGMAVRHQARMDAIHAAGDASTAAYNARDVASDNNQRGFLNYIQDEHTVSGASGRTFQVDNRYERYYLSKNDNSYIGVKGGTTLNDLPGVNPGDYEEGNILR